MKTLVAHQAALGDWVLTFPLLRGLRHAGHDVLALTTRAKGDLARQVVGDVMPIDIERRDFTLLYGPGGHREVAVDLRDKLRDVHLVISFMSPPDGVWTGNLRALLPDANVLCADPKPDLTRDEHLTEGYGRKLREQGFDVQFADPPPCTSAGNRVVFHPGSGGPHKCWPIEQWLELAERLTKAGRDVRAVVGEVEVDSWPIGRMEKLRAACDVRVCDGPNDLLREAPPDAIYIGNDAGPTHLAAQRGAVTVAVFGPTDPRIWSPRGPAVTVLAPPSPGAGWPSVEQVFQAVDAACVGAQRLGSDDFGGKQPNGV